MQIGIKVGYTDECRIVRGIEEYCSHVELFLDDGADIDVVRRWNDVKVPRVIHVSYYTLDLGMAQEANFQILDHALYCADACAAEYVVFHAGNGDNMRVAVEQLSRYHDERLLVETMPLINKTGGRELGSTYEELRQFTDYVGLCLDVSHAVCSAISQGISQWNFLERLRSLSPTMLHFTDGWWGQAIDAHLPYGDGNYPLCLLWERLDMGQMLVTNECLPREGGRRDSFIQQHQTLERILSEK